MKTLSRILTTGSAVVAGAVALNMACAFDASAITLVQTQTFSKASTPTIWSDTFTFAKYAPGGLVRVEVLLDGSAISQLTATASTAATAFILNPSSVGANIIASSALIPTISVNVLPVGIVTPTPVTIPGNSSVNLSNLSGSDSDIQTILSGFSPFEGAGSYTIDLLAIGSSTLTTGGGNINTSQSTSADSTLTVKYYISDVPPTTPEPAAVLGLLAVAGVGVSARRRLG